MRLSYWLIPPKVALALLAVLGLVWMFVRRRARKPERALGLLYWMWLVGTVAGLLGFPALIGFVYRNDMTLRPWLLAAVLSALWLIASAAWGHNRQKVVLAMEDILQQKAALQRVRRWCWGILLFLSIPTWCLLAPFALYIVWQIVWRSAWPSP